LGRHSSVTYMTNFIFQSFGRRGASHKYKKVTFWNLNWVATSLLFSLGSKNDYGFKYHCFNHKKWQLFIFLFRFIVILATKNNNSPCFVQVYSSLSHEKRRWDSHNPMKGRTLLQPAASRNSAARQSEFPNPWAGTKKFLILL